MSQRGCDETTPVPLVRLCVVLLLIPVTALAAPTFDQAVDLLVGQGYPQHIDVYLDSLARTDLGFAGPGRHPTTQRPLPGRGKDGPSACGNVRLEPVPVTTSASRTRMSPWVTNVMQGSTFIGIRPTPADGITVGRRLRRPGHRVRLRGRWRRERQARPRRQGDELLVAQPAGLGGVDSRRGGRHRHVPRVSSLLLGRARTAWAASTATTTSTRRPSCTSRKTQRRLAEGAAGMGLSQRR